jgi:hypothetical protein
MVSGNLFLLWMLYVKAGGHGREWPLGTQWTKKVPINDIYIYIILKWEIVGDRFTCKIEVQHQKHVKHKTKIEEP